MTICLYFVLNVHLVCIEVKQFGLFSKRIVNIKLLFQHKVEAF